MKRWRILSKKSRRESQVKRLMGGEDPDQYVRGNGDKDQEVNFDLTMKMIMNEELYDNCSASEAAVMKSLGPAVTKFKAVNQEFSKVYWKIRKRQTIARDKVIPVIDALALKYRSAAVVFGAFMVPGFDRQIDVDK